MLMFTLLEHHSVQRELREIRKVNLPYRVEVWDDTDSRIEEIIALTSDYATAKSAYTGAGKIHYASTEDETYPKHSEELTSAARENGHSPSSSQSPIPRSFGL
jgi:hypothetical protein